MFHAGGSIRAVLFDAVGTLIRPEPGVAVAYLAAARRFGVAGQWTEQDIDLRFRAAFARQEELDRTANWATDELRERRRWEAIVAEVFGDVPRGDDLFAALWSHFADPANWILIDSVREQLAAARAAGLIVGVASNFDARLHAILAALVDFDSREYVFVSSEIGWRKPSREFFRAIEERLRLSAGELLLVGDDEEKDFQAAQTAGWRGVLVNVR